MNAPLPLRTTPPLTEAFLAALTARFADQASTAQAVREHHGRDESPFPLTPPDAVVFARSTQDIADCVKLCAAHAVPVVPYGAGSSLEGNFLAVQGGVCIDVSQMNAILAINAEDLTPHRSRRRRQSGRHECYPRQRHQCRALRHHARERARPDGGDPGRCGHPHRPPRKKEQRWLRPHAPVRGQRRYAGRDCGGDREALPAARGHQRRGLHLSERG